MNKFVMIAVISILGVSNVYAGGSHHSPPPSPTPTNATSNSVSGASSKSDSKSVSGAKASNSTKIVQDLNQKQVQHQSQNTENSGNNTGTSESTNVTTVEGDTQVRQAPSVAQGSFAIQGCSTAGNGGGSNTHGSAFLGFGFTPAECYAFLLAQSYQAVGQQKAACEVLNTTDAAKRAEKRGVKLPDCGPVIEKKVESDTTQSGVIDTYTREEVDSKIDRAFRRSIVK